MSYFADSIDRCLGQLIVFVAQRVYGRRYKELADGKLLRKSGGGEDCRIVLEDKRLKEVPDFWLGCETSI